MTTQENHCEGCLGLTGPIVVQCTHTKENLTGECPCTSCIVKSMCRGKNVYNCKEFNTWFESHVVINIQ